MGQSLHERGSESAVLELTVLNTSWVINLPTFCLCLTRRSIIHPAKKRG
jgi:hypothetical protein